MFVCFVITVQKPSIVKMPKSIERCVRKQNIMFMHEGTQFSAEYFQFMKRLLTCNQIYTHTSSSQDKLVSNLVHTTLYTIHQLFNSIFHKFVSWPFFSPNQIAVLFENLNFYFMKTANILVYGNIEVYSRYYAVLSKNRLYTKILRIHLFNIFTIKTSRALAALMPIGLFIVKTLTNVL